VAHHKKNNMPTPERLKSPFYPGNFYHVVCKSVDGILLFPNEADYPVFLDRFKKFMGDFVDTWAYCLLNNHSHHIWKIKTPEAIQAFIDMLPAEGKTKSMQQWIENMDDAAAFDSMLERQMNRFLVSYVNYYNNKYVRSGAVFQSPFKRVSIEGDAHLQMALVYVNANAQKHKLVDDFSKYRHSSYGSIVEGNNYFVDTVSVLEFFGGLEKFVSVHKEQVAYFYSKSWPSSKIE
jgi:putative transposase